MAKCAVLVVAAGRGRRLGGETPKQYLDLGGRMILRHSLALLCSHPGISQVLAVIHPDDRALYDEAARHLPLAEPVAGGETRQQSVLRGLEALVAQEPAQRPDLVLIHDGARPFLSSSLVAAVIRALDQAPAALPALAVVDTLKRGDEGKVAATVERAGLWRAQTPQGFRFAEILAAHRVAAGQDLTDDAAVAEAAGIPVQLVPGDEENVKITTPHDLERARQRVSGTGRRASDIRLGNGFDVHAFAEGSGVWLCGVQVPHDRRLSGHSDADVALHALTDAILGAIGAGDIGLHFPPTDARWRGASSDRFLRHAADLVRGRGGVLRHVDVTIICERPKVGPHRAAMITRLAEILEIAEDRVSVKATTTEGLGFTGRREGIAAQATAVIALPG